MTDLGRVADELEVRNVLARLALLADDGDLEAYVQLWTSDAAWEMPGAPRHGRDAIRQSALDRRRSGEAGPGSATRHLVSTVAVTVDGDEAVAESYWQFITQTTTTPVLGMLGHYRDTLVRTDDGWRVARRQITVG